MSAIRYEDRIFVTGASGTGKSTLALRLLLSAAAPRLVIDPSDSLLLDQPGFVTFRDPRRPPAGAATARFVPADPADRDAYDLVYQWAWARYPRWVLLDEAGVAAPAQGAPRWLRTFVVQGRKRGLGHLACHTRPREVDRNLIAQAAHVFIFATANPDDRAHLAALMGVPPALLESSLAALPWHGFLWWSVRDQVLTACPPLAITPA
jgi:DNA helicase HerA-like ATPase